MRAIVTGGAGFIGSHLVDVLIGRGYAVKVLDNLSAGRKENLVKWLDNPSFKFVQVDLLHRDELLKTVGGFDIVWHIAANPEVRLRKAGPQDHFEQNIKATYNLLEALRKQGDSEVLVFTSTSTVYGEAKVLPTPEDYGPLKPISLYGASKLASEALFSAYASMYGFKCVIFRMANVVGPRCNHGVIYDFVNKLKNNPKELEVLGDGTQSKSYLYVDDCIRGMLIGTEQPSSKTTIFNIGSGDRVDVKTIAEIVIAEMKLKNVDIRTTGGVEGGRGWKGDVKQMQLDMSKLKLLGWQPQLNSAEAVRKTAKNLAMHARA